MTPDQLLESLLRLQHFETSPEEKGERTLEILTHIEAQDRTIEQLEKDQARLDWLETHKSNIEMQEGDDGKIYLRGNYMRGDGKTLRQAIDNARETQ